MSSDRWEKSFSFRALRAEPSAALTLRTGNNTHTHRFIPEASQCLTCGGQTGVAPLRQREFPGGAADLVLVKAGHQLAVHFDVGAAVASLFVVVGGGENSDDLQEREASTPR